MDRPPCLGTAVAVVERRSVLAERCRGIGAALAPHIINVVRLIVQMGSAVAEQAASKGVRVAGGIREGRPRCGRKKKTATVSAVITELRSLPSPEQAPSSSRGLSARG